MSYTDEEALIIMQLKKECYAIRHINESNYLGETSKAKEYHPVMHIGVPEVDW